ncbi:MAG TPA: outer membrane beta-barrel family protein [Longimicrobium sp.]|nr:outer membrane beta-barrel family protein [Longimicrobium sp.]
MTRLRSGLAAACLLLLSARAAAAQEGGITGRVIDGVGRGPLAGVQVVAQRGADTTAVARAVTGADGRFALRPLAPGSYVVRTTGQAGRRPGTATVQVAAGATADAGTLELGPVLLEAVQVQATRPPVVHAEDRNVYSVKDMPVAAGAAADVMRTLPELEVELDGSVKMVGNRAVTIYINGRPSPLRAEALNEFIKNMPADRIDRIEVIPNPSVRFEGGDAAIVNIVLRRDVSLGLSGSVALNAASRGGNGLSGQVAYQRGRLTVFGGGSSRLWAFDDRTRELRQNLLSDPITFLDMDRRTDGRSSHASADLTAEWTLGEKETLWASATGYLGGWGDDGVSANRILDAEQQPTRIYERRTDSHSDFLSNDLGFGFRRIVDPQKNELSFEVRRNGSLRDGRGEFEEATSWQSEFSAIPYELRATRTEGDDRTLTAKADYMRPLGASSRIEGGVRASAMSQDNDDRLNVFTDPAAPDPSSTVVNDHTYRERQYSAYANLTHKIGRLSLQGGLRAEATHLRLEGATESEPPLERDYFLLSPSANLSMQVREGVDARVSYSRRTRRPGVWELNPFVQQTDPLNLRYGNPDLQPARTHSFNGDVSWRARITTLRLAPYYRRTEGEVEYVRTADEEGVVTSMPQNLTSAENYGASLNLSVRPGTWGTISASVSGNHDERRAEVLGPGFSRVSTGYGYSANASLQPRKGLSVQASVRGQTPRETLQGRYSSTAWTQLSVRKDLFKGKSSLDVRMTDPLGIHRTTFQSRDRSFSGSGSGRNSWGGRSVAASFTYRFGRPPQRKSTQAEGGAPAGGGPPQ